MRSFTVRLKDNDSAMEISKVAFLLLCLFGELFGLILFLQGFLPFRKSVPGYSSFLDVPREPSNADFTPKQLNQYIHDLEMKSWKKEKDSGEDIKPEEDPPPPPPPVAPVIGRTVIMLIDALREDFVFGPKGADHMQFTRGLIDKGQARSFVARAQPPTVTMPRIKAITSGTIPGFMDVVLNLRSDRLEEDNLISQLHRNGKSIYFFGDDTWLKLFPGHFKKTDGTTSSMSLIIPRHLPVTLVDKQWDVLILHYLGLDHIGHLGGPDTPLVGQKLEEMDEVVQQIYEALNQGTPTHLPSLFILCGDHGMSDVGSHGGASPHEIHTPLVFLSGAFDSVTDEINLYPEVQQIDLAPTLSLLLGVPIPLNSLGGVIPELVEDMLPPREVLRGFQVNTHQLASALHKNVADVRAESSFELYQQALRLHSRWLALHKNGTAVPLDTMTDRVVDYYTRAQSAMQDRVSSSLAKYDTFAMMCGIILLFQVFLLTYYATYQSTTIPIEGVRFYPLVAGSFLSIFFFCCVATITGLFIVCTMPGADKVKRHHEYIFVEPVQAVNLAVLCVGLFSLLLGYLLRKPFTRLGHISPFESIGAKGLVVGTVIHTASLLSSSFDEEEHQTWYFLSTTLLLLLMLELISLLGRKDAEQVPWSILFITLGCLMLFRIQRSWNQTGIKWAHMPDVGDWFLRPDHRVYLTTLMVVSIVIIYLFQILEHEQFSLFFLAGLVGATCYRNAIGSIDLMLPIPVSHKGIYEAWFTYAVALALLGRAIISFSGLYPSLEDEDEMYEDADDISLQLLPKGTNPWVGRPSRAVTDFYQSLIVLIVLLLRPHNIAVVAVTVTLQHCIVIYLLPWLRWSPWKMTLLFVWLGQSAFFAQGNSNSAATVDISAGYVGLESHHLVLASLLTSIATFSGPFLWIVLSLHSRGLFYAAFVPSLPTRCLLTGGVF
ncbi:putative GPI ethanolamine phosphate transferase 2 [Apostichopus japonicus]|uniref:Putative GPI ethanolamine phosphate transferase 2 n=1 Tax=Stichopus japonicus TaxID=307972 RepID=A0A2G8K2S5_STIJA|nr:putative GPI ethanolamine phosphate transferase 2 [Apostichopus japonicus]